MRRIQGILAFHKKYGVARFDEACSVALDMEGDDWHFVNRYLARHSTSNSACNTSTRSFGN
jgi:hypothetical protein